MPNTLDIATTLYMASKYMPCKGYNQATPNTSGMLDILVSDFLDLSLSFRIRVFNSGTELSDNG